MFRTPGVRTLTSSYRDGDGVRVLFTGTDTEVGQMMTTTLVSSLLPVLFIVFIFGLATAVLTGHFEAFPLLILFGIGGLVVLMITPEMMGPSTPAAEDVTPTDWSAVWAFLSTVWWVVSWLITILLHLAALYTIYRLVGWTRQAFIWFVSPPPRWLCRWLNRPLPLVFRPLPTPQTNDRHIYVVPDDPIFVEIDRALDAADRMLQEDRLS